MLLKKLAKLRRTILWCAVFAVSHLAFGAADYYFPTPSIRGPENGGLETSLYFITNNVQHGKCEKVFKWSAPDEHGRTNSWESLTIRSVPASGYSLKNWTVRISDWNQIETVTEVLAKPEIIFGHSIYISDFPKVAQNHPFYGSYDWKCWITPVFTANVYRVTFDLSCEASETTTPNPIDVTYDSAYGTLPIPTLAHNDFAGWTLNGKSITATNVVQTAANHTLTATWNEHDKYTVTISSSNVEKIKYCIDDGQSYDLSADNRIYNVYSNSCVKVWAEPKEGYSFANTSVQTAKTIPAVTPSANTLSLVATANTYTIKFEANGGSGTMSNLSMTYDTEVKLTANSFTRTGYTFAGWATSSSGAVAYANNVSVKNLSSTSGATVTLYAKWSANPYKIAFNANGGSGSMSNQSMTYDTEVSLNANGFTRTGYTFVGWATSADGPKVYEDRETVWDLTDKPNTTVNLYAVWSPNTYTVSFDLSYESSETTTPAPINVTYASTYGTLPDPARTGYTFSGWYTAMTGGTKIEAGTTVNITDAQTLYAHWTANKYTVTFDANDGSSSTTSKTVTYDSSYGTLPNPSRTGYTFSGWYTEKTGGTQIDKDTPVTITAAQTLYAHWTAKKYTVTLNANGGALPDGASPTLDVTYDSTYGTLPVPARTGYTFSGWFTSTSSSATQVEADTTVKITAAQTLYAHWTANKYTVTFNANGGALPDGASQTLEVTYDSPYGTLPDPARTGYTFSGWYLGSDRVYAEWPNVTTADNHTLVASWTPNKYSLSTYIKEGYGSISVSPDEYSYEYGTSVALTAKPGTGYSFAYWEDDSEASAVRTITIRETDNFYAAAFTANVYRVTFDINAPKSGFVATPSFSSRGYTYNATYDELPTISHIEYEFLGWYTRDTSGSRVAEEDIFATSDDKLVLYAHWKKLPRYEVTFVKGTGVSEIYYKRDGEDRDYSLYSSPTNVISYLTVSAYATALPGYTAKTSAAEPFASDPIEEDASFTLTATPNTYTVSFDLSGETSATTSPPDPIEVTYGSPYGELPTPTKSDGRVVGWYLDSELTTEITAESIFTLTDNITLYAKWYEYDVSLTEAADCVGLTIRSEGNPSYDVGKVDKAYSKEVKEGDACVYLTLDGTLENKATYLISDIEGSGKLSFWWKLQNEGFLSSFEAVADLVIITNNVESISACFGNEFTAGEFPITAWRYEEIELKDVASLFWRVSSSGSPSCEFYLDNVKWIPAGAEKSELEKWAEYFQCEVSEEAVAAAFKANCHLTISFDNETGKPIIEVIGLSDAELASKVKIECCEDLSNSSWNEHNPAQHSNCRFFRGTLELTVH